MAQRQMPPIVRLWLNLPKFSIVRPQSRRQGPISDDIASSIPSAR